MTAVVYACSAHNAGHKRAAAAHIRVRGDDNSVIGEEFRNRICPSKNGIVRFQIKHYNKILIIVDFKLFIVAVNIFRAVTGSNAIFCRFAVHSPRRCFLVSFTCRPVFVPSRQGARIKTAVVVTARKRPRNTCRRQFIQHLERILCFYSAFYFPLFLGRIHVGGIVVVQVIRQITYVHYVLQIEHIFVIDKPLHILKADIVFRIISVCINADAVRIFRRAREQHLRIGNDCKAKFAVFRLEIFVFYFFPTERVDCVIVDVVVVFLAFTACEIDCAKQAVFQRTAHIILHLVSGQNFRIHARICDKAVEIGREAQRQNSVVRIVATYHNGLYETEILQVCRVNRHTCDSNTVNITGYHAVFNVSRKRYVHPIARTHVRIFYDKYGFCRSRYTPFKFGVTVRRNFKREGIRPVVQNG